MKSEMGKRKKNNSDQILAWLMSGLFGVLSGIFLVIGYQLEKIDRIDLTDKNAMMVMVAIMAVLTVDTMHVWKNYNQSFEGKKLFGLMKLNKADYQSATDEKIFGTKEFLTTWGILVLLNLPVLLAVFPGFFVYDAQDELNEVLTRSFTTHHPLLHVLLLGGMIALIHKVTGSWNAGIFSYIFLQMLVITAVFAYVLVYMSKRGIGKRSRILWTLYYGLFPTIVMYTLCSSKDGLFTAFLLLLIVLLTQLVNDKEGFLKSKGKCAAFVIAAILMPCFRHNGFYAYLVFLPFALIYFRKELKKKLVFLLVIPVIAYLVISKVLALSMGAQGKDNQEMLTVPIMQLSRVYTYDREDLSAEDIKILTAYLPEDNLKMYTPRVSDLVKVGFNNEYYEKDKGGFWKLWAKELARHPMTYVNAWFLTSYGYWYPPALINVYKGTTVFTFTYDESSYFGYEVESPGTRTSFIPVIDKLYRFLSIGSFHKDAPVLALLFSPGMLFLIYLFVILYRLSRKDFKGIIPFMPLVLVWLTVLLGPTYLVRYVVILWTAFPVLMNTGRTGNFGPV